MKYSMSQAQKVETTRQETAWKYTAPLLNEVAQRYGVQPSDTLIRTLKTLGQRVDKVIMITFAEFNSRWPEMNIQADATVFKLGDTKTKSGFPAVFVYAPEFEEKIKERNEQQMRTANCKRLCSLLSKITLGDGTNDKFKDFVMTVLPSKLPYEARFDGSRERVLGISKRDKSAHVYEYDDSIIGVLHTKNGEDLLTVFIDGLDYKKSFARYMEKKLEIPAEIAEKISDSLPHDEYYTVRKFVDNDFEHHTIMMARLLGGSVGDKVTDLIQGEVDVILGEFSKKIALDLDDELPSAILINGKVNLYMPKKA